MPKIVYTTLQFNPVRGGTEKMIEEYYNYFNNKYSARVVATNLKNYRPDQKLLKLNDQIIRTPVYASNNNLLKRKFYWYFYKRFIGPTPCYDFSFPKRYIQAIENEDPDLIHASDSWHHTTFWAMKTAQKRNKPFVLTPAIHLVANKKNKQILPRKNYSKINCLGADAILTYTQIEKQILIERGIDSEKCHVVELGIYPEKYEKDLGIKNFKNKLNIRDDEKIVLFIGKRLKQKGIFELMNALKYLEKRVRLLIIGPPENSFQIPLEFNDRIIDLGETSEKVKLKALQICDIFCLPSIRESFGIVYLEAWMYEKPVIACNIPTSREIINDEKDGLLIKQYPKDIAEKINYLLKNPKLCRAMGSQGKKKVLEKYTWNKILPKIEKIYSKFL